MSWIVELHDDFLTEFEQYSASVQESIAIRANLLKEFGTQLSRPHADSLKESYYSNMKEPKV